MMNKLVDYFSDSYTFAQIKVLRKMYGGRWTRISVLLRDGKSTMSVWVKGEPLVKYDRILKVEEW